MNSFNTQIKAKLVQSNSVTDVWEVYNLGSGESEFVSFPVSMEAKEDDAISKVFRWM